MAITPKRLVAGTQLTSSWTLLYYASSSVLSATTKQLVVCNTDTVARTFHYAVTPLNSAPAPYDGTIMFNGVTLQPNETKLFGLTDVIPTGSYIQGKTGETGSGNYVTITVSGMENS